MFISSSIVDKICQHFWQIFGFLLFYCDAEVAAMELCNVIMK